MYYIAAYQLLDVVTAFFFLFQAKNIFRKYRKLFFARNAVSELKGQHKQYYISSVTY